MTEPTAAPSIRTFVALELPDEARAFCAEAVVRARSALGAEARVVRWVDPESMHLTLKFLGAVPAERVADIIVGVAGAVARRGAFKVAIGGLGLFPNQRKPRVLWLALLGDVDALRDCQERVEVATVPLGFPREQHAFQPHLTLGRVREGTAPEQLTAIGRLPAGWPSTQSAPFAVTSISLMQSHLSPQRARYTHLAAFSL